MQAARVLILDDNEESNEMVKRALSLDGIPCVSFTSAGAALDHLSLSNGSVRVVVLDLSMPVLDGLSVAEQIRKNEALAPHLAPVELIFFTAQDIDESVERIAERTRVRAIIQKGSGTARLPGVIEELLRNEQYV